MSTTAINSAGTSTGLRAEIEGRLAPDEQKAARKALGKGVGVSLKGKHPYGLYSDQTAIVRPGNRISVAERRRDFAKELMSMAFGTNYQKRIARGEDMTLPNGGDYLLRIDTALNCIMGWEGVMADQRGTEVDLTGVDAEGVRQFLRDNYLPWWRMVDSQTHLPEYDADAVDVDFLELLEEAVRVVEEELDFFAFARHLRKEATSETPATPPLSASSGSPTIPPQGS